MTAEPVSVGNQLVANTVMAAGEPATQAVTHGASVNGMMVAVAENMIYLIGYSFILGSLFTIFILLLLDYMRQIRRSKSKHA
jgi:hypothetical protein